MKRKVRKFAGDEGSVVRTRSDKEFEEDSKYGGYGRYMPKTKEYTFDEAKEKLAGLFGGKKEDTSKYDELESVGGAGRRARTIQEQIGSKTKSDDTEAPRRKISDYSTNKGTTTVSEDDVPSKVEKTAPPRSSGSGSKSSSNKSSSNTPKSTPPGRSAREPADNDNLPSRPYPENTKSNDDRRNKPIPTVKKDEASTDKIIDKTVKDTSGAKTVYSDKPFSFTKNLQDKKDKEKKSSSADDRYKTYKETNAKYQKMLDDYKNKKDDDSKVSGPGGARAVDKTERSFKGTIRPENATMGGSYSKTGIPATDAEGFKAMKDANKANLRAEETEKQRTFKERAEAAKAEADKAEKKAARAAKKEGPKAKSSSTAGKMPGPKMSDPYSMILGSDLDPKRMMRDRRSSGEKDMKKGGQVKSSSASSRADGIAARGKTRGKIY